MEGPWRTESHDIGGRALRVIEYRMPRGWVSRETTEIDYGRDLIVELTDRDSRLVGHEFLAQIKGALALDLVADGAFVSYPLKVSTVTYLLGSAQPAMLIVCQVFSNDEPAYWVWIDEAIQALQACNPGWRAQDTVTLRVPISQPFGASVAAIAEDVRRRYRDFRLDRILADAIRPGIGASRLLSSDVTAESQQHDVVLPGLQALGIVDAIDPTIVYGPKEVALKERLLEVGTLLESHRTAEAREILGAVATDDIAAMPPALTVALLNRQGVLALRDGRTDDAYLAFARAVELKPKDAQHLANLLSVEAQRARDSGTSLPCDWDQRLDDALADAPGFKALVSLKAIRLSATQGLATARAYVEGTPLWGEHNASALVILADAAIASGGPGDALKCAEDAEAAGYLPDAPFLSMKGVTQLMVALGEHHQPFSITGQGRAGADAVLIRAAYASLMKAAELYTALGFPRESLQTIASLVNTATLLGEAEHTVALARAAAGIHQESSVAQLSLATALLQCGDATAALRPAQAAFALDPSATVYRSTLLVAAASDDPDAVLSLLNERRSVGFSSLEEEVLSYVHGAAAYAELGDDASADAAIAHLRTMEGRDADATVAELGVASRRNESSEFRVTLCRTLLERRPNDPLAMALLAHEIGAPSEATAPELVALLRNVSEARQLTPPEVVTLARSQVMCGDVAGASEVLRDARQRYCNDPRILWEAAFAAATHGDDEAAYATMHEYFAIARSDQKAFAQLGWLAASTGRLDEAIALLQRARVSGHEEDRARVNGALFELRRRRGDAARLLIPHVVAVGEAAGSDPEREVQFLCMALMTPLTESDAADPTLAPFIESVRARLNTFVQAHPDNEFIHRFQLSPGGTPEEHAREFVGQMAFLTLPRRLAESQFEMRTRGAPWPLSVRAHIYCGEGGLFKYSDVCAASREYSHSFHIQEHPLDVAREACAVPFGTPIVVDITALLTFESLGLLDALPDLFPTVVVASGARTTIRHGLLSLRDTTHPLADALNAWMLRHRGRVRVRVSGEASAHSSARSREDALSSVIGDGVGESLEIAKGSGLALLSDEVFLRMEARKIGTPAFGTLAVFSALRTLGSITAAQEAEWLVALARRNSRYVAFSAAHLQARLVTLLDPSTGRRSALVDDDVLNALLVEFGERQYADRSVLDVFFEWWDALLGSPGLPEHLVVEAVSKVVFALDQRWPGALLTMRPTTGPVARFSVIWAALLHRASASGNEALRRGWALVKASAAHVLARDERQYAEAVVKAIPDALAARVCRFSRPFPP